MEYKPRYYFSLKTIFEGTLEGIFAIYPILMIVFLPLLFCLYYPNAIVSGSIISIYAISIIICIYKLSKHFYVYLKEKEKQTICEMDDFEYIPEIPNPGFSKKDFACLSFFAFLIFICLFLSRNPPDLFSCELSKNFIGKFLLFVNNMLYNHEILFSICCLAIYVILGYLGVRFRDTLYLRE